MQAFRTLGYACVVTRSELLGACRTGDGDLVRRESQSLEIPSTIRPSVPTSVAGTSFPQLPSAGSSTASGGNDWGIPVPTPGGTSCPLSGSFEAASWAFLLPDGTLLRGHRWFVKASPFVSASSWTSGNWACVAAHDVAWPGGASSIADVPVAGCARVSYPGSAGVLEQVVVYPNTESGTNGAATTAQVRRLNARIIAIRDAVDTYGIGVVALAALTAERLDGPPPGGRPSAGTHPLGAQHVSVCGATSQDANPTFDVYGSRWTHGSEHGSRWQLAVNAGYPCELARLIFLPFLTDVLSGPNAGSLPAERLHRYGWTCTPNASMLIAVCAFTATGGSLGDAIAKPVPAGIRIGVRAVYTTGATRETLSQAIEASL